MMLSLSPCIRVFVRTLLFSLMFLESGFKGVSRKFKGCFKEVSRVFQGSLKGVSRKFKRCFKNI